MVNPGLVLAAFLGASPAPSPVAATATSPVGPAGGRVPALIFAVVGDTRPALPDEFSPYPIEVASQIKPQVMAEILAQMSADVAERLTVELVSKAQASAQPDGAAGGLPKIEGQPIPTQ